MAGDNLVSIQIPQEDLDAVKAALTTIEEKLLPHLVDLTKEDRKGLPKMRDKTVPFVEKALEYAETNSQLVPAYLNVPEMRTDFNAVGTLTELYRRVEQLYDTLDDTILLSGSEAYKSALNFYKAVKNAAKAGAHGAEVISNDLKQRFEKSKEKKNP